MVIGGGLAGLSAACYMARSGWQVTLLEKNSTVGGRIQYRYRDGFRFNLGPTVYLMPDIFEEFFKEFGLDINAELKFKEAHPYFRVIAKDGQVYDLSDTNNTRSLLEQSHKGSGRQFKKMMNQSRQQYASLRLNYFNSSWSGPFRFNKLAELLNLKATKLGSKFQTFINNYVSEPAIKNFYSFVASNLDGSIDKIPGLMDALPYILTGHPMHHLEGGMDKLSLSLSHLAQSLGVYVSTNTEAEKIVTKFKQVTSVKLKGGGEIDCDAVISAIDYKYAETKLLSSEDMSYSPGYWSRKKYGPSILIITVALNQQLAKLKLHNVFASALSSGQSFYVHASSRIDTEDAPSGCDNLVIQVPILNSAADRVEDLKAVKAEVYSVIGTICEVDLGEAIIFDEMRAHAYFEDTFNATEGSCYGLSPRLGQIGPFAPAVKSKTVEGLFYSGQDTIAGSSMALALNSGRLSAYALLGKRSDGAKARN